MDFPDKLRNFRLNLIGTDFNHTVSEIELPKLTLKTEEWQGSSMDMPIELDMGMEKLEAKFKFDKIDRAQFMAFGLSEKLRTSGALITGKLGNQSGEVKKVNIVMTGLVKSLEPSSWKIGDKDLTGVSLDISVWRYALTVGGEPWVLIDAPNGKRMIMGIDANSNIFG